jgi:glycosyltransferase involved in cell wall biosynthesis
LVCIQEKNLVYKILLIGAVNINKLPSGGEEYKNQLILEKNKDFELLKSYVDTHDWKKKPTVLLDLIFKLFFSKWDCILLSTSSLSAYRLILFIKFFKPSLLSKLNYLVVGGYFPEGIRKREFKWEKYKALKNIIVQGDILKNQLLSCSELNNVEVIPNFKKFDYKVSLKKTEYKLFKFVFIGRISKPKGILEIIEAVRILKTQNPLLNFSVDFYGPKEEEIQFPEDLPLLYKGYLDIMNKQQESYAKLSEYSCMLFPTFWQGEGFPGVIIDAYVGGLPVIATDWNMNIEVVEDGETGLIVPIQDANALALAMLKLMQNPDLVNKMSENSLGKANDFHIDTVWPKVEKLIYI